MRDPFLRATDPARSIEEVIIHIDEVIEVARGQNSPLGYFAALYRHVAVKFKSTAESGGFERPDLIDGLDVTFLNRYLEAIRQYQRGGIPSNSWKVAFEAIEDRRLTTMQHLLLGMNAHINFDLGIAVASSCTKEELPHLRGDFEKMNALLGSLLEDVETDLARIWPTLALFHRIFGKTEDTVIDFSMKETRELAWRFAEKLVELDEVEWESAIATADRQVADLGRLIHRPVFPANLILAIVRWGERGDVHTKIDALLKGPSELHGTWGKNRGRVEEKEQGNMGPNKKTGESIKVAILGGGVSAMTTALELTDPQNPKRDQYDITVYQIGWRLGGKGASGRNIEHQYRIEEHGLHIWFGCYDNAFRLIRKCYEELNRPPDAPLATWRDAFKPHSEIVLKEHIDGEWRNWMGGLPSNDLIPGEGEALLPLWDYATMAIKWMLDSFQTSDHSKPSPTGDIDLQLDSGVIEALNSLTSDLETSATNDGLRLIHGAYALARYLGKDVDELARKLEKHSKGLAGWIGREVEHFKGSIEKDIHSLTHELIVKILGTFMGWLWRKVKDSVMADDSTRRMWILSNFIYANISGGIQDGILAKGFDAINDHDYRDWLSRYAYDDGKLMLNSAWVLGTYDAMFAYVNGDNRTPKGEAWPAHAKLEAGNTMRAGIRQFLAYKGASVWKMQAGMGDTIFGPAYEVLKRRGVTFRFFHRVREVIASSDGKTIDRIKISRQVDVKPDQLAKGGYDPLVDVKGLPCWPSTPSYDQIVNGETLKREGINLEAYHTPWKDVGEIELKAGADFDIVVMGISLGALPYICSDLILKSEKWKRMVDKVKTIRTQAVQLWLKPTAYELGWELMQRPIVTGYEICPIDTWADMSHLIDREGWTVDKFPLNLSYFVGPMKDDQPLRMTKSGPMADEGALDQKAGDDEVRVNALELLEKHIGPFCMPNAVIEKGGEESFDWNLLVDPRKGTHSGTERFDSQYWHSNVMPSERYVLSVPGSSKHRLPAHDASEFTNLYLAGDWTDNGFNLGCVEAATMSGLLASNAISGFPDRGEIIGLDL